MRLGKSVMYSTGEEETVYFIYLFYYFFFLLLCIYFCVYIKKASSFDFDSLGNSRFFMISYIHFF